MSTPEIPQPDSIVVTPATATIDAENQTRYVATAHWPDSTTTDESANVTWSTSDPAVATVLTSRATPGLVIAHGVGTATITATYPLFEFLITYGP